MALVSNAVFLEEYNTRFFRGETVWRTAHIYNERMTPGNFNLRWGAGADWQTKSFTLPAAGQRVDTIKFQAPVGNEPFRLQIELNDGTNVVFSNTVICSAMPHSSLDLPPGVKLGLYDPAGAAASLLARFGVSFAAVTNLSAAPYDQLDLLVVGPNALTNEPVPEVGTAGLRAQWRDFAMRGGWVLVLEQTNYPAWMPAELGLQDFDATFAFPNPAHPVTHNLAPEDLRWWAGDHRVAMKALASPARGNSRVLASIGSRRGLEYAAAVEVPIGRGGLLCSQWLLSRKCDTEPLAGVLLQRVLNYCSSAPGHLALRPAALLAEPGSAAASRLLQLGLLAENFSGRITNCKPSIYPLLIIAGTTNAWHEVRLQLPMLTSYVERGGTLVLHRPESAFLAAAQPVLFPDLDYADVRLGLVLRRDSTNAAVRLANHDLYWIDQAGDWNRPELLSTNLARRTYRKRFSLAAYNTIQVEDMPIHTSGGPGAGGWWLWSNGYVAQDIFVSQPGTYLFNVLASGTPALGGWPQMSVKIDGRAQDSTTVPTNQPAWYSLSADLTAGTHQLALSFDNDAYAPAEDRNATFDYLSITAPAPPRIAGVFPDSAQRTLALQWEGTPGKPYEVQMTSDLAMAGWQSLTTLTNIGTVSSWVDNGDLSGGPPLGPGAPRRVYRIRQVGP